MFIVMCLTAGISGTKSDKRFSSKDKVSVGILSDGNFIPKDSLHVSFRNIPRCCAWKQANNVQPFCIEEIFVYLTSLLSGEIFAIFEYYRASYIPNKKQGRYMDLKLCIY